MTANPLTTKPNVNNSVSPFRSLPSHHWPNGAFVTSYLVAVVMCEWTIIASAMDVCTITTSEEMQISALSGLNNDDTSKYQIRVKGLLCVIIYPTDVVLLMVRGLHALISRQGRSLVVTVVRAVTTAAFRDCGLNIIGNFEPSWQQLRLLSSQFPNSPN